MIQLKKSVALYQQITNFYEKEIVEGRLVPGSKIPATTELARKFNVNSDTIQQSLKLLMNRGLVERTPGRGTFVRHGVNTKAVGIIFGKEIYTNPDQAFFSIFLDTLNCFLEKKGWHCQMFSSSESADYDKAFYDLKSAVEIGDIRGVVEFCSNELIKDWLANECPVPYVQNASNVDFEDFTNQGLSYLLRRGCQQIVFIAQEIERHHELYKNTVKKFCQDNDFPEEKIKIMMTNSDAEQGYEAIKKIYKKGTKPDGLLVGNDAVFRGALYALLELCVKIPDDIKVLTYANKGIDIFCHLPLTKLEVDPQDFAQQVYDEILAKIDGNKPNFLPAKATLERGKTCGE